MATRDEHGGDEHSAFASQDDGYANSGKELVAWPATSTGSEDSLPSPRFLSSRSSSAPVTLQAVFADAMLSQQYQFLSSTRTSQASQGDVPKVGAVLCNVPRGYSRAKLAKELYKAGFRPGEDFDMSRIRIPAQGAQQCFDVYLWLRDVEVLRKFAAALNGLRLPAPSKASRSGVVSVRTIEPLPEEESSGLSKVDVSAELDPLWVTPKLCVEKQACWRPPGQFETPPHVPRPELAVSGGHREATRALFCTGCGLVVPEGARFCSGCGCSAALVVSMPYCSRCGAANSSSHHKFCHDCGAALPCRAV